MASRTLSSRSSHPVPRGNVPRKGEVLPALNDQERTFARAYVEAGGNVKAAAAIADLGTRDPDQKARDFLRRPEILLAIQEEQRRAALLCGSVALTTLIDVATDTQQPGTARVAAAKALADLSGLGNTEARPEGQESATQGAAPVNYSNVLRRIRRVILEESEETTADGSLIEL